MNDFYESVAKHLDTKQGLGESWGWHYLGDYFQGNDNVYNEEIVRTFFKDLIDTIKMTPVGELWLHTFEEPGFHKRAISAVQVITQSTITAHFEDKSNSFFIDVFSCAKFDPLVIPDVVNKYFDTKKAQHRFLLRNIGQIKDDDKSL